MTFELNNDVGGWPVRLTPAFSTEGRWADDTLVDWAERRLSTSASAVALVEGDRAMTFAEVIGEAKMLAAAFLTSGLRPGDVVSFQLPNWREGVSINLALAYAGLVANPIVPIYREAELRFILRDALTKLFITPGLFRNFDYEAMATALAADCPELREIVTLRTERSAHTRWEDFLARGERHMQAAFPAVSPNAVKLIMYTSGTTASAKGVLHTHNTITTAVRVFRDRFDLGPEDVVFMPSPITHITGYLFALELIFLGGLKAVLTDRWEPDSAVALIEREGATISVGTTPFLSELLDAAKANNTRLPSLKFYMCGGAAVPAELIHRASSALENAAVFRVYGSTETPNAALGPPLGGKSPKGATTDGQITNYDVRIVDRETGQTLTPGAEGEILLFGPQMMVGYSRAEDNVDAFTADGFFRSGDLGHLDAEGYLTVTGRSKDIINRGGEKFSPKEIEDILHRHPDIAQVAIVAMPHPRLGETACAFVVPRERRNIDLASLVALLAQHGIAKQKFPEHLELVDGLPLTASGKVRKNVLRDMLAVAGTAAHKAKGYG